MAIKVFSSHFAPPAHLSCGLGSSGDRIAVWAGGSTSVSTLWRIDGAEPHRNTERGPMQIDASLVPAPGTDDWIQLDLRPHDMLRHIQWLRFSLSDQIRYNTRADITNVRIQVYLRDSNMEIVSTDTPAAAPIEPAPPIMLVSNTGVQRRPITDYFTDISILHRLSLRSVAPLEVGYEPAARGLGSVWARGTGAETRTSSPHTVRIRAFDAVGRIAETTFEVTF